MNGISKTVRRDALLGREKAAALIQAQYDRLMPAMSIAYAGMVLLILASSFAVLTGKTVLPRWMFVLHMIVFQILFVLIPDIRQRRAGDLDACERGQTAEEYGGKRKWKKSS